MLGLLSNLMLRNPENAAAASEAGCLEAVLEVMAADTDLCVGDPRNAAQWVQRQVACPRAFNVFMCACSFRFHCLQ